MSIESGMPSNHLKLLHLFNQKRSSLKKGARWFSVFLEISSCGLHPKASWGISLTVQWLRMHRATQGKQLQSLVWELSSHMLRGNWVHGSQIENPCTTQKIPHDATKTQCSQTNKCIYIYIYFLKGLLRNRYGVSQKENHLLVDEWEQVSDPQEGRRRPSHTAKRMKIPAVALQRSNKTSLLWYQGASQVVQLVNNMSANAGDSRDVGSTSGSGRSLGEGTDNPVQYYCVGNSMDRGAWQATAHVVTKSKTWLSVHAYTHTNTNTHTHTHTHTPLWHQMDAFQASSFWAITMRTKEQIVNSWRTHYRLYLPLQHPCSLFRKIAVDWFNEC